MYRENSYFHIFSKSSCPIFIKLVMHYPYDKGIDSCTNYDWGAVPTRGEMCKHLYFRHFLRNFWPNFDQS